MIFRSLLPPGTLEVLLFVVLVGAFIFVVRNVRNRHAVVLPGTATPDTESDLPFLETPLRVRAAIRRVFRDPAQDALLVEAQVGKKRFVFRAADAPNHRERYEKLIGTKETADLAVYALATLAPGGAEAIRHQIKDWDKANARPDMVGLFSAGQYANDYAVIARIVSHRDDTVSGESVWVYRAQVVKTPDQELFMELAVDAELSDEPFPTDAMVHGSARLFGSFAPN